MDFLKYSNTLIQAKVTKYYIFSSPRMTRENPPRLSRHFIYIYIYISLVYNESNLFKKFAYNILLKVNICIDLSYMISIEHCLIITFIAVGHPEFILLERSQWLFCFYYGSKTEKYLPKQWTNLRFLFSLSKKEIKRARENVFCKSAANQREKGGQGWNA